MGKHVKYIQLYYIIISVDLDLSPLMILGNYWGFLLGLAPFIWSTAQVWNTMSGAYMSCKGHNARCVCAWLSSCLNISLQRRVPPRRLVGSWLETEVALNHMEWPEHDMLAPSAVCMNLDWINITFWWQVYKLAGLYPCAHWCPHRILRDALNRLFCGMERSGRYLWHGSDVTKIGTSTVRSHEFTLRI